MLTLLVPGVGMGAGPAGGAVGADTHLLMMMGVGKAFAPLFLLARLVMGV